MITLENAAFTAEINEFGAEVTALTRKQDGRNFIWDDPEVKYWGRHAPLLFPSIGKSNDDQYRLGDATYPMSQHGFARDYQFDQVDQPQADTVVMTLHANDDTKKRYPFEFALTITYKLTATGLAIQYAVANQSQATMPFALGFHPAFTLDAPLEEYHLQLAGVVQPLLHEGVGPAPFRDGTESPLAEAQGDTIPLSHAFLDDGLVILNAKGAKTATLFHNDEAVLSLDVEAAPYVTIWSPEHKTAPFVCVEPFFGLPDQAGEPGDWAQKAGNTQLAAGKTADFAVAISIPTK